ncbi:MAG TPA: hypothetical protein ENJ00_11325 [Phycisphaerales bacterium]|nr:hypothetical protein [Phycisphaerales bacterium]
MPRPGQTLFLCALALLTIGVLMVTSAGMEIVPATAEAPIRGDGGLSPVTIISGRIGVYAALALLAMAATAFAPKRLIERFTAPNPEHWWRVLVIATAVMIGMLLLVYIPGISRHINASSRWIEIPAPGLGTISIQPSELVKWAMLGLMAWGAVAAGDRIASFWRGLMPMLACLGLVCLLIMKEDMGTALLIGATGALILLAGGARFWHMAALAPVAAGAVAAGLFSSTYRMHRITSFVNPYDDPAGAGFHIIQSMGAIAGGEGVGRGLGNGLQKFGYLPEDTTDFIFSIISEELGLFGVALVLFLYALLITTSRDIMARQQRPAARLLALGIMATIGLQACINLLVVTKLAPTKGIALPLISSGGTGWILTCAAIGMLIRLDRFECESPSELESVDEEHASRAEGPRLPGVVT